MDIAVVNGFPRFSGSAEIEYITRFIKAANRLGHRAYEVVTSDDIHECQPDFVLVTHEFTPKLTPFFTVGALWSPPEFFNRDARRVRSIRSYDACLVGAPSVGRFLDDLDFATGISKPRSDFNFLPTALSTDFRPRAASEPFELVYFGVHWDGLRHNKLLEALSDAGELNLYGPSGSWNSYPKSYRGAVAFDGNSVAETLARHGIALCIHKQEHYHANTPSMRLFEAAAASCLIISDGIDFARETLGNSAFYLNMSAPPEENAAEILRIVKWANDNPRLANQMARCCHDILKETYSIEKQLEKCCAFVASAKAAAATKLTAAVAKFSRAHVSGKSRGRSPALVDVIIRTGGRDLSLLRRAIRSVTSQTLGTYKILLVDYKGREDVRQVAAEEATSRVSIQYLRSPDNGARSTALWTGLQNVTAPFFANQDDDDTFSPEHLPTLLSSALEFPDHDFYYSGLIRVEEDAGDFISAPNFQGPLEIEISERKDLVFLDSFNLANLVGLRNFIGSNSFIARSECLDTRLLQDPFLVVGEDMYLYLMLARKRAFKSSGTPTAFWHWRSTSKGNSMLNVQDEGWQREGHKLLLRLANEQFCNGLTFEAMRLMLSGMAAQSWPLMPATFPAGEEHYLSSNYLPLDRQLCFHGAETHGIWSSAKKAMLRVRLEESAKTMTVRLTFSAAGSSKLPNQIVAIDINGQDFFRGRVDNWTSITVEKDIEFQSVMHALFITVRCEHLFNPLAAGTGNDSRDLGVYLAKLSYVTLLDAVSKKAYEPS
ncbi:glycosyltransferase [Variovorax sp. RHLX14]|uniref:glycosyltransferase n=1 Tax=Variovorax sp. RHLX14 TaxID=1259731 RepID=UPI003F46600A